MTACPSSQTVAPPALHDEREQGENAPLALVVGTHDERDVLHGHDHRQRQDDERQHAVHVLRRRRHAVLAPETFLERVQRARADVAIDDPDCGQRQCREAAFLVLRRQGFTMLLFWCVAQ